MKVEIEVKPNSNKESIEQIADKKFRIRVNAPPRDGKANKAVIEALAKFFGVPKSSIVLLRGEKSKKKLFEIVLR